VRDTRNSVTLLVGTRVTNQRHGSAGIVASGPFRESPDGSDRRARVLVDYADSVDNLTVDYVRDLDVFGDEEWMSGFARLAAMACSCDPFKPCSPCAAGRRAAAYERAAAQRPRQDVRGPGGSA
jgi:hypothetical protein